MTPWPKNARLSEVAEAEPVAAPAGEAGTNASPPVDLDYSDPSADAGPALPAASPPLYPRLRKHRYSAALLLALTVSAVAHGAMLAYFGDRVSRAGMAAAVDAVSVEIILETAPNSTPGSNAPASQSALGSAAQSGTAEEPPATKASPDDRRASVTPEEPAASQQPEQLDSEEPAQTASLPEARTETTPATPDADNTAIEFPSDEPKTPTVAEARSASTPEPDQLLLEQQLARRIQKTQSGPQDSVAVVVLPQENIPVPTPRPMPPKPREERVSAPPADKKARSPEQQPRRSANTATRARGETPSAARNGNPAKAKASAPGAAASAGLKGGATAGEKAAYARRLIAHVERHKRYPRDAARQNISGAAGLSITIDQQGRLAGARIARSSGHSILDQEALAVARRASPYPRPPEGVGGKTLTFSVTLRFKP